MKDEALTPVSFVMETLPIAQPSDSVRDKVEHSAKRLIDITEAHHTMRRTILDWLRMEHEIEKASLKLQSPTELDSDAFAAEVKRIRGKKNPLSAAASKACATNTPAPSNRPAPKRPKPCNWNAN